ncbi:Holo-[acyl-carrier-protein] synthase [Candidatus Erwinia haradaeae]|uniref:Holo-[acyl-carrier-protein] synthase n=1 Tax=Candidatus Erwinia haradaeae TaxID=1922217 RepID=A0A451D048_9GAMM|nr:holo-ACP synthase [Candidatus Erwinia haradaeae]VFP78804.1 Holo-[acyl-carrier-protein] synthase [Candidatus Erwinia haradaeae]
MAILGIGIDIVEIFRVYKVISRKGDRLAHRILSESEWIQYQKNNKPERFLAKRLAVKEAASKAFGTGMQDLITFNQFEVCHDKLGKPFLCFLDNAKIMAKKLLVEHVHVTLSDERRYTCAMVVLES